MEDWKNINDNPPEVKPDPRRPSYQGDTMRSDEITFLANPENWTDNFSKEKPTHGFPINGYYYEIHRDGEIVEKFINIGGQELKLEAITDWRLKYDWNDNKTNNNE